MRLTFGRKENQQITCLAIGKDCSIIALKRIVQDITSDWIEHYFLWCKLAGTGICWEETVVEGECLWLFSVIEKGIFELKNISCESSLLNMKPGHKFPCLNPCATNKEGKMKQLRNTFFIQLSSNATHPEKQEII